MTYKDDDKILVNRDGVDYQADVGPLIGPVIKEWKSPDKYDIKGEMVPFAVGESACRPGMPIKWSTYGPPREIQLEDGSFGYVVSVVCGGGNPYGEQGYLMIVNDKLEEQKVVPVPSDDGLLHNGTIMCWPHLYQRESDEERLRFNNILVWSDTTGIWGSFDYGDSWTQFKGYYGDTWIPTKDNCHLNFNAKENEIIRAYYRLDGSKSSFTGITNKFLVIPTRELGDGERATGAGLEGMLHTDLLDMPDPNGVWSYKEEKESSETFPEPHQVLSYHYEASAWFRTEHEKASNSSTLNTCKLLHHKLNVKWTKGDSLDSIFDIYATEFGQFGRMVTWKADFHKRWIKSIPDHDIKVGGKFEPGYFCIGWDPETMGYLWKYRTSYYWMESSSSDSRQLSIQTIWTSSSMQDAVVAYHSSAPFLEGEEPDSRYGESVSMDEMRCGTWFLRLGTTALMRFGDAHEWRLVDAPVVGQEDTWWSHPWASSGSSEVADWAIHLPDKRIWSGEEVTMEPIYSMKDGLLIDDHFIELVYPEAGQIFHPTLE